MGPQISASLQSDCLLQNIFSFLFRFRNRTRNGVPFPTSCLGLVQKGYGEKPQVIQEDLPRQQKLAPGLQPATRTHRDARLPPLKGRDLVYE